MNEYVRLVVAMCRLRFAQVGQGRKDLREQAAALRAEFLRVYPADAPCIPWGYRD